MVRQVYHVGTGVGRRFEQSAIRDLSSQQVEMIAYVASSAVGVQSSRRPTAERGHAVCLFVRFRSDLWRPCFGAEDEAGKHVC